MRLARMPSLAPLADVPDRERRDGFPQPVIRRKHPVVAMPVFSRRWDEIGHSSPIRAISFAQAIRDVSCERGF